MILPFAISPCPNDTFLFHAWIEKKVGQKVQPKVSYADIQQLNQWAYEGNFPLIKLSFNCFGKVVNHYQLLPIGNALGFNCGPKIISKSPFPIEEIHEKRVAIPGKDTTAHLLFERLIGQVKEKRFCLYHEIESLINNQTVDAGVIIHETRFTFKQAGFVEIADLGTLWHKQFQLPLPLGGLAIRRDLSHSLKDLIIRTLQDSLRFALFHPEKSLSFILSHSQEKDPHVVSQHIQTYVNAETKALSSKGKRAIELLLNLETNNGWLYEGLNRFSS
ncbi:MAG: 1,4-dihydroxy-6-naphthoate synthase [Chlamydiales bacterium]